MIFRSFSCVRVEAINKIILMPYLDKIHIAFAEQATRMWDGSSYLNFFLPDVVGQSNQWKEL